MFIVEIAPNYCRNLDVEKNVSNSTPYARWNIFYQNSHSIL